jgi:hypothetical protein
MIVDPIDEYCRLGENKTMEVRKWFPIGILTCFESTYMKQPTSVDFTK